MAYLMVAQAQYEEKAVAGSYNIGPDDKDNLTTGELVTMFCNCWNERNEAPGLNKASWETNAVEGPHEAGLLRLNCDKIKSIFYWKPKWDIDKTIDKTVEWYMAYIKNEDMIAVTEKQIKEYME